MNSSAKGVKPLRRSFARSASSYTRTCARYTAKITIAMKKMTAPRLDHSLSNPLIATASPPPSPARTQSTATAARSDRPMATSLCDEWSRPPTAALRPERSLEVVTRLVSKIGMSRISTGPAMMESTLEVLVAVAGMRDRQDGEIEPDEEAPAVAHEDSCGMHVIDEKSGGRSEQNGQVFGLGCHPDGHDERRQQRRTRDEADASAQPVHVVEQVEGIGQPDDPEDGQQRVERQGFDPCQPVTEEDEHGRESDLRHELRVRLQRNQVVRDADDEHGGAADEEPEQLTRIDQQRAEHEHREGNRNSAKQRCRVSMPAILAGFRDVTQPDSQEAAQRDEQNRERETRDGAREELGRHLRSTERHA